MKRMIPIIAAALAVGGAHAADKEMSDKEKALQEYERTGETKNCLSLNRIDSSEVVDDRTILFHLRGDDVYLNELPYQCPQLGFYESYTYSTTINQLCNTEIITVLDTAARQRLGSCGLGKFERLSRKEDMTEE